MASAWISRYATSSGERRFRVPFRLGGRETTPRHGGSFKTQREAQARRAWIVGELANLRVPDLRLITPTNPTTLADLAERWQSSRVDVSEGTLATYRVALGRLLPRIGTTALERIDAAMVAELVA